MDELKLNVANNLKREIENTNYLIERYTSTLTRSKGKLTELLINDTPMIGGTANMSLELRESIQNAILEKITNHLTMLQSKFNEL